jgi:hypothetical protein
MRVLRFALFASALLVASNAAARDSDSTVEATAVDAARDEFKRGAELARAQRWAEARKAFERSYQLRPHPVTSYNIGYCERAVGHPARALHGFERALSEHEAQVGGVLPPHLIELATKYRAEVALRVARVEVVVPVGAHLSIDGAPVAEGSRPRIVLLDPGPHVFVVAKPGFVTTVLTRDFADGQQSRLELPLERPPAPAPMKAPSTSGLDRRWSYVALGAGVASLVAAGVAGGLALRKRSLLEDACGPSRTECPSSRRGDIEALGVYADASTIAALVGATGLVTGAALFFSAGPSLAERDAGWSSGAWSLTTSGHF